MSRLRGSLSEQLDIFPWPDYPVGAVLEELLQAYPKLHRIATDPAHEVQILYTQIDHHDDASVAPVFRSFAFRAEPGRYFYPASTVKLPAAVLALEKLEVLRAESEGARIDRYTHMRTLGLGEERAEGNAVTCGSLHCPVCARDIPCQ